MSDAIDPFAREQCGSLCDPQTGTQYPLDRPRWRSEAGGPLMISRLPGIARGDIDQATRSLWRYAAALPS